MIQAIVKGTFRVHLLMPLDLDDLDEFGEKNDSMAERKRRPKITEEYNVGVEDKDFDDHYSKLLLTEIYRNFYENKCKDMTLLSFKLL